MKHIDIERLVTVRHRAEQEGVVPETIRSRIRKGKMDSVSIDGVMFVETIQEKGIKDK
ncbi:MAG: hypothetical protein IAB81_02740 [Bacteroidetes bacterium]|uniref:Uncharacterized protein n=1 Tax=Candidatus Merdivivens pullicola TaxID=2840872 RepID=A0A9D9IHZ9_9BACT|nr:hypothetical protein [Candidatus Merdivivens pullicola]